MKERGERRGGRMANSLTLREGVGPSFRLRREFKHGWCCVCMCQGGVIGELAVKVFHVDYSSS